MAGESAFSAGPALGGAAAVVVVGGESLMLTAERYPPPAGLASAEGLR